MKLLPFQVFAINWLSTRDKAFLALEQGLGKTVIASRDLVPPAIVVCPASMKWTWFNEFAAWRPELKCQVIRSSKDVVEQADVHIINYDILSVVHLPMPNTLVIDECHYAKSYKAKRTKAVVALVKQTKRVRLLSGTPIVNRPIELWPMMHAIKATKLGYFEFGMHYCAGWKTPWDTYDFSGSSKHDELNEALAPIMLRMTKTQVLPQLPPKTFSVVELDLPVDKREKQFNIDEIEKHPDPVAFEALSDVLRMNAHRKLPLALQHIHDALESTDKVVVFAHHTDIVQELMTGLNKFNPVRVVGADSAEARYKSVDTFQADPTCRVFVGNIKAAGVGLTLTAASRVIFVESSWSPADIQQCADRCHRIGQVNPVAVEILTIHQSIDAHMLHSVLNKMDTINLIIKDIDMNQLDTVAIAAKLRELADLFETAPAQEAKAAPAQEAKAAPAQEAKAAPTITMDQVREAFAKMIHVDKREQALGILKANGATKVGELKPETFAGVMAAINSALV